MRMQMFLSQHHCRNISLTFFFLCLFVYFMMSGCCNNVRNQHFHDNKLIISEINSIIETLENNDFQGASEKINHTVDKANKVFNDTHGLITVEVTNDTLKDEKILIERNKVQLIRYFEDVLRQGVFVYDDSGRICLIFCDDKTVVFEKTPNDQMWRYIKSLHAGNK